jgi:TPR repeat protein
MMPEPSYEDNALTRAWVREASANITTGQDIEPSHLTHPWLEENNAVAEALVRVAGDYREGPFPRDISGAIQGLQHEARRGNASARFLMGDAYLKGFGLPKGTRQTALEYVEAVGKPGTGFATAPVNDLSQALESYRKLAESGNSNAALYVGLAYDMGQKLPHNPVEAAHWYREAAGRGNASAATNLGVLYHNGDGWPKDDIGAVAWFERAASSGSAVAEYCLGRMYLQGDGVPKDEATAAAWLNKAAQRGNAHAQILLSSLYATGRGVSGNTALAYMWINLASTTEPQAKKARDQIESAMPAKELEEGQRLSHAWIAQHMRTPRPSQAVDLGLEDGTPLASRSLTAVPASEHP